MQSENDEGIGHERHECECFLALKLGLSLIVDFVNPRVGLP